MSAGVGRLRWVDLGTGGWEVQLADGGRRPVSGPLPPGVRDGDEVDWVDAGDAHGFLMTGAPAVRVAARRGR